MDVAGQLEEVVLLIDQKSLIPALEDMTHGVVLLVEVLRISGVESLHDPGQIGPPGFDEEMDVAGHQGVGVHLEIVAILVALQKGKEISPILVAEEYILAVIALEHDMIAGAGLLNAVRSSHDSPGTIANLNLHV